MSGSQTLAQRTIRKQIWSLKTRIRFLEKKFDELEDAKIKSFKRRKKK